jgi:hypothetical protein
MDSTNQTDDKKITISPIQLLVNSVLVAYQRGAYTIQEAGLISQAVDFFTVKTNQAKLPEVNQNKLSDIKEESEKEKEAEGNEKPIMLSQ